MNRQESYLINNPIHENFWGRINIIMRPRRLLFFSTRFKLSGKAPKAPKRKVWPTRREKTFAGGTSDKAR